MITYLDMNEPLGGGMAQCRAKSKRSGVRCKRAANRGGELCHMHGGSSPPPGPTHPNFKHGRYSKALDGHNIQALYEQARADPHLLALTEDIALLVAKQQDTLSKLLHGESEEAWHRMAALVVQAREAMTAGADGAAESALGALGEILAQGLNEIYAWREFTERADQIRRLIDTERKYQEGLRLYLPLDRANAIMQLWLDAIRRTVPQEYIAKLHDEFRRLRPRDSSTGIPTIGRLPRGRDVTPKGD